MKKTNTPSFKIKSSFIVLISMSFLLFKYLIQIFPSVMTSELQIKFHLNALGLGNLAACFFYSYLIMQIFAGPILDRYPLKYIASISLIIASLGTYLFSITTYLWIALLARILMGIGAAFATVSYLKMVTIYFKKKYYPIIAGFITLGVMIGALCGQVPLISLINHVGWQHSITVISVIGFCIALLYFFSPQANQTKLNKNYFLKNLYIVLKEKHNWYLLMYSGLAFAPLAVFGSLWGIPFIKVNDNLSTISATEIVSWMYIGLGLGGPFFGYIAKKTKELYPCMFLGILISLISTTTFIYSAFNIYFIQSLCLFFLGFGTGAFMLGFNLGKNLNSLTLAATVVAVINSGDAFLSAITDPIIGETLDLMQNRPLKMVTSFDISSYHISFSILPIYLILSLICLLKIKRVSS